MAIYLGLDIGKKRTGIAKSDSMGIIVKPLKTILTEDLLEEIENLDQELGIEKLIIGEPVNIQEGNNEALTNVHTVIESIKRNLPQLEIEIVDERFTSKEAESIIRQKGIKLGKDNKALIDQYAAAIILETFWAMMNNDQDDGDYVDLD